MEKLYNLFILFYRWGISLGAIFHSKARQWINGRKNLFEILSQQVNPKDKFIWFHCASLGEFEQGRPIIENIQPQLNQYKILITFFSPSGYENQKNYVYADVISYLPLDTEKNMKRFVELLHFQALVLVKYEFWPHMISTLHSKGIPIYVISAMFRKDQIFFQPYGRMMRRVLKKISHFFVQNAISQELLYSIGITNVTLCGDTRFDRVAEICRKWSPLPVVEKFRNGALIFVAGSTWQKDENFLVDLINRCIHSIKFILVPHEIHPCHMAKLRQKIFRKVSYYSECSQDNIGNSKVMIVNAVGLLPQIYGSADIVYVGGGFGKEGIHNVLEPAVFGIPIIFGPVYNKFPEAQELLNAKAAKVIKNFQELEVLSDRLISDSTLRAQMGVAASSYTQRKTGATATIVSILKKVLQGQ